ncbi:MAG: Transcription initiation factor IIA subunit 1, partial [Paramarteilia canceri]
YHNESRMGSSFMKRGNDDSMYSMAKRERSENHLYSTNQKDYTKEMFKNNNTDSEPDKSTVNDRRSLHSQYDGLNEEFIDTSDEDFKEEERTNEEVENKKEEKESIEETDEAEKSQEKTASEEDPDCVLHSADDLNDSEEDLEGFDADNFIVCQYDKVARTKTRWSVQLRNGVVHIDGREYTFCKANGILEW